MSRALALSDEQLDQVWSVAKTVPQDMRDVYLERLAEMLADKPLGDGFIYRACREASRGLVDYPLTQCGPKSA
jgi:hypothetical protein